MLRAIIFVGRLAHHCPTTPSQTLAKGEKRQRESWELMWYWGMFGGIALGIVLKLYQPDTT